MGLSRITTRTGDDGSTGLADGSRLPKDHPRIAAIGSVDELNSHLGILLAEPLPEDIRGELLRIRHDPFDLGVMLASPGGARTAALCHVARCVAHRTERDYLKLSRNETAPSEGLQYLNRLSDLLFVLCRVLNTESGGKPVRDAVAALTSAPSTRSGQPGRMAMQR